MEKKKNHRKKHQSRPKKNGGQPLHEQGLAEGKQKARSDVLFPKVEDSAVEIVSGLWVTPEGEVLEVFNYTSENPRSRGNNLPEWNPLDFSGYNTGNSYSLQVIEY